MTSKQKNPLKIKVAEALMSTFSSFQQEISPKKFKRTIKKATKVIVSGLKQTATEKSDGKKKAKTKTALII